MKHGIGPNDIITFNYNFLSTSIVELNIIDESSHENASAIFIAIFLIRQKKICYRG